MKIFVSYARERRPIADAIVVGLEQEGHRVFFERQGLLAGEEFHARIRREIAAADLFVFLLSPESVAPSSYALTELCLARERWPNPSGHVLPVVVQAMPIADVPPYLRVISFLEPEGDLVAGVLARIATIAKERSAPLQHRLRSRLEGVTQALSYVSAAGTLFQAAANWEETVNFVVDHAVASLICLLALAALFASTLLQDLQLRLPRWKANPPEKEQIGAQVRPESADRRPVSVEPDKPRPTPAPSRPRQPPWWKRSILAVGSLVTVLALGVAPPS